MTGTLVSMPLDSRVSLEILTAVVGEGREGSNDSALLSTTWGSGRDEDTGELAPECSRAPETSSSIPEGLPLCWEVSVTGWDTEKEGIVGCELGGINHWVVGLGWCVHLEGNVRKNWWKGERQWLPILGWEGKLTLARTSSGRVSATW